MQKDNFVTQARFEPKICYPKKCVNYDKSNSPQNSVNGPKDPNVPKNAKKLHKVPKYAKKNANKKGKIATLLTFLTKKRKILQRFYPR